MKKASLILITLILIAPLLLIMSSYRTHVKASETTIMYIDPTPTIAPPNAPFNITVKVQNAVNLSMWQIELYFSPTILTCTNYTVPPDNIFGTNIINPKPIINNTIGRILAFCAIDASYGVTGSGTLCKIEFIPKIPGISPLDLTREMTYAGTYLADPDNNILPFTAIDGTVQAQKQGFQQNTYTATFDGQQYTVLVYTNSSTIENFNYNQQAQEITYQATGPDATKALSTTIIPKVLLTPVYAILANTKALPYTKTENATHIFLYYEYGHTTTQIKIRSTIPYDLNGDRKVDGIDMWLVAKAFGSIPGSPNWNPIADANKDGKVDGVDMWLVAKEFGKIWNP